MAITHALRISAGIAAGLAICATATAQQQYQFIELKTTTGPLEWAAAINNARQIAAVSYSNFGYTAAAMWSNDQATTLETSALWSRTASINAAGQIAGFTASREEGNRAAVWSGGARTQLAAVDGPSSGDYNATAINDAGVVAGNHTVYQGSTITQAVAWRGFDLTTLDMLGANSSFANGINNAGQIVGYLKYDGRDSREYAAIWNGSAATILQTPGSNQCCTRANAINDSGLVVGSGAIGNGVNAVVWRDGISATLDSPSYSSYAFAVNNAGLAVGTFDADGGSHAGLWNTQTGALTDLNSFLTHAEISAGWSLVGAYDINDLGDIVGQAYNQREGSYRPFALLAVPEPGTSVLMVLGLVALIAVQRAPQASLCSGPR